MKRLIAIGLAAVLSAAMIAATSSTAAAGYWYDGVWYNTPGPYFGPPPGPYAYYYPVAPAPLYPYYYYNPGPPAIITSLFSSVLGAFPRIAPAPRRLYAGTNPHVAWCMRYRTYNPATNTYFVKPGVPKTCVSPYPYPMVY